MRKREKLAKNETESFAPPSNVLEQMKIRILNLPRLVSDQNLVRAEVWERFVWKFSIYLHLEISQGIYYLSAKVQDMSTFGFYFLT